MPRYALALFIALISNCAAIKSDHLKPPDKRMAPCDEKVVFYNINPADMPLVKHYINRACEISGGHMAFSSAGRVRVMSLPFDQILSLCSRDGTMALGCTVRGGNDFSVFIPHGSPGVAMHEILHIVLWKKGVPSGLHHVIMKSRGWYWVNDEGKKK